MDKLLLTTQEVASLTGKVRHDAQRKVLNSLGIKHKIRPDGTLVILRAHVENELGGVMVNIHATPEKTTPNWSAIN